MERGDIETLQRKNAKYQRVIEENPEIAETDEILEEIAVETGAVIRDLETIIFSYDEILKISNNKGFLLQTI